MDGAQKIFEKIFSKRFALVGKNGQSDSNGPFLTLDDLNECIESLDELDPEQRSHLLKMFKIAE